MRVLKDVTPANVGDHVIFVDPVGKSHDALILAVHGTNCINLAYVDDDVKQFDNYGRKVNKQYTSCSHGSIVQAHGNFWLWPGEKRIDSRLKMEN